MPVRNKVGKPDGPKVFVPEIGCEVGTFLKRHGELEVNKIAALACLMHEVPHDMRGPYKPQQLANYTGNEDDYPLGPTGYVMCRKPNKKARKVDPKVCQRQAINRSGSCEMHGGRLHPLDKLEPIELDTTNMTRWQKLVHGVITVDDLDDEELIRGMCRRPNGSFPEGVQQAVPRKIYDKMVTRLFDRAQEMLRENLLAAVDRLSIIVQGDAFEPADQIKAVQIIFDRVLGKAPDKVELTVGAKPYEQILQGIAPLTRDESRARRAIENTIDAEVVDVRDPEADNTFRADPEDVDAGGQQRHVPTEGHNEPNEGRKPLRRKKVRRLGGDDLHGRSDEDVQVLNARMRRRPLNRKAGDSKIDILAEKVDRAEAVRKARNRRYAARSMGRTDLSDLPFMRKGTALPEGGWRIQWIAPDKVTAPARTGRPRNDA